MDKGELIDKYRYVSVEHFRWYADIEYEFKQALHDKYCLTAVHALFTGFSCQGDGASFSGSTYVLDKIMALVSGEYPAIKAHMQQPDLQRRVLVSRSDHRYYHEFTMNVEVVLDSFVHLCGRGTLREHAAEAMDATVNAELEAFEAEILELMRGEARDYYRKLEEEYNWLTSDDVVWDWVVSNGLNKEEGET